MLEYDQTVDEAPGARSAPQGPTGSYLALLSQLSGLFARNTALILAVAALCAVAGFGVSKILTPRYTASVQIYVDPHGLPGVDKEGTPLAEDSNGFINFVESQSLVITSRIVLEHVVASEKLDRDDKLPIYARAGIPHAWLIDAVTQSLEVYVLDPGRTWRPPLVLRGTGLVRAPPFEAIDLDLSSLWP